MELAGNVVARKRTVLKVLEQCKRICALSMHPRVVNDAVVQVSRFVLTDMD